MSEGRESSPELETRTGYNPIELMAIWNLVHEAAAMPASIIVQIALWPDKLADWAEAEGIDSSVVYNMLAGIKPYRATRERLAARLGVSVEALDALIDQQRRDYDAHLPVPDPGFREWVRQIRQLKSTPMPTVRTVSRDVRGGGMRRNVSRHAAGSQISLAI